MENIQKVKGGCGERLGIAMSDWRRLSGAIMATPGVEDIIVYGSRAKGTHRSFSDIDITLKGSALKHTDLFPILDRIDDLLLPYEIDLSLYDELDYAPLVAEIDKYGISLSKLLTSA